MRWAAFAVCIVASATDVLDGHLARRNNEITEFGKIIDPLADKIFVATMVIVMLAKGLIPLWLVLIVLGRDALILLGGLLVERRTGVILPSNYPGKAAVVSLSLALVLVLIGVTGVVVDLLTWLAVALLAVSITLYARRAVLAVRDFNAEDAEGRRGSNPT